MCIIDIITTVIMLYNDCYNVIMLYNKHKLFLTLNINVKF